MTHRILNLINEQKRQSCPVTASTLTPEEQEAMVNKHNELRAGEGASDMRKLEWSQEIADIAQQVVDDNVQRGALRHDFMKDCANGDLGQNIYTFSSSEPIDNLDLTEAVDAWFSEKKDTTYAPIVYPTGPVCTPGEQCGHYTQVVWAKTMEVGCAYALNSDKTSVYIGCNYRVAGNMGGEIYYKKGDACSECGFKETWDSGFKCENNLCAACDLASDGCTDPPANCEKLCTDDPDNAETCQMLATTGSCDMAGNEGFVNAYCSASCGDTCPPECARKKKVEKKVYRVL